MLIQIDLQNTVDSQSLPKVSQMQAWLSVALKEINTKFEHPEITIRVVSPDESRQLNLTYRGKDKPTNVLSFPFEAPEMIPIEELDEFLGDLVVCEQIIIDEANSQHKTIESHWAHMLIHGVLHLQGFDHIEKQQAEQMEAMEIGILNELGFPNPY